MKKPSKILGTYSGEAADATITNLNGMDITREVWENVFASDEYKRGLELGHYIGYLGHPEDPGCQEFEKGCIVMTHGEIQDDGIVYAEFNLVDTPVGRIVQAFQNAGVTFGISVRGAGDLVGNSVDPDTFVFRGFDLVAFPAYPDAIPTFTEIAASTNAEDRKKYQKICAAVDTELESINSTEAIDELQKSFAPNSETYKNLEARKKVLATVDIDLDDEKKAEDDPELNPDGLKFIFGRETDAMTKLYIEKCEECKKLRKEKHDAVAASRKLRADSACKLKSMNRIYACQVEELHAESEYKDSQNMALIKANKDLKKQLRKISGDNLSYRQKISASNCDQSESASKISELQRQLAKTVSEKESIEASVSNTDREIRELRTQVTAANKMLGEYQQAYASMYATAVGLAPSSFNITADTSVQELKAAITASSNSTRRPSADAVEDVEPIMSFADDAHEDSLVTL